MDRILLKCFFNCGDNQIIEFAILRARLNVKEREVLEHTYDDCMSVEKISEIMNYSPRRIQDFFYSAADKLLKIAWVKAYAQYLLDNNSGC